MRALDDLKLLLQFADGVRIDAGRGQALSYPRAIDAQLFPLGLLEQLLLAAGEPGPLMLREVSKIMGPNAAGVF
jgi:hypothetical protein